MMVNSRIVKDVNRRKLGKLKKRNGYAITVRYKVTWGKVKESEVRWDEVAQDEGRWRNIRKGQVRECEVRYNDVR